MSREFSVRPDMIGGGYTVVPKTEGPAIIKVIPPDVNPESLQVVDMAVIKPMLPIEINPNKQSILSGTF
ncbi:hypothetical protein HYT02_00630 [Candidatus Gottesmanbacteria bacterium]|nr:hypothetical protein [Candidatus Gottesmanbacteria bacterium]